MPYLVDYRFLPGLRSVVLAELDGHRPGVRPAAPSVVAVDDASVVVRHDGPLAAAVTGAPRTVGVAYLLVPLDAPRPRALLGHEALARLAAAVESVALAAGTRGERFSGLRLAAAGSGSPVMRRLAAALAERTGLGDDPIAGDLVVRVVPDGRRSRGGWRVGVRLTPRPLSSRPWQVARWRGALEPTLAAAMVVLSRPRPTDTVLDLCCGSATLLASRLLHGPARRAAAVDHDPAALAAAAANLTAAGMPSGYRPALTDARTLGFRDGSFTTILANPPWGHRTGTHGGNRSLYPALLAEAARVAAPRATLVLVSHELRLVQRCLAAQPAWRVRRELPVAVRGHHPHVWVLSRCR